MSENVDRMMMNRNSSASSDKQEGPPALDRSPESLSGAYQVTNCLTKA